MDKGTSGGEMGAGGKEGENGTAEQGQGTARGKAIYKQKEEQDPGRVSASGSFWKVADFRLGFELI